MNTKPASKLVNEINENNSLHLVDVRSSSVFALWHNPGSKNYPLYKLVEETNNLPGKDKFVVFCNRGNSAKRAAQI